MTKAEREIDYIIEYLSSYVAKIKTANKAGLFNNAVLYELFAKEICKLWYGVEFENLNAGTFTFPYIDLISKDSNLYVQVTSQSDLNEKIHNTLIKIRDSKSNKYKDIPEIIFFALTPNEEKIKDYIGKNKIGNISFRKSKNLITITKIIERAKNDRLFKTSLYNLLHDETEKIERTQEKLKHISDRSKNFYLPKIVDTINGEYHIDRTKDIENIKALNKNNICIIGPAGCGKSALCKNLVENENVLLYARAESFLQANHLNNIWDINIKDLIKYTKSKKIIFFIDSIESISDKNSKLELLEELYWLTNDFKNINIITSCRNTDNGILLTLSKYMDYYSIGNIDTDEFSKIKNKYPIISKLSSNFEYSEFFKSPFYLNLIITKCNISSNFENEHVLRKFIWENVICLKDVCKKYDLKYNEILSTVVKITTTRSMRFLIGVHKEDYDSDIINALISEDVLCCIDDDKIRLKYDIYEDICFEHLFDKSFDDCKNNYLNFYNAILQYGNCAYRRYQIWISNKLFNQASGYNILHNIIFSDTTPNALKKETLIGIIKSDYCLSLIINYSEDIIECGILKELIELTNLYAFNITKLNGFTNHMLLSPSGQARSAIIHICNEKEIYKDTQYKEDLLMMCNHLTIQNEISDCYLNDACSILEYYLEAEIDDFIKSNDYHLKSLILDHLNILYKYSKVAKDWIILFWKKLNKWYKEPDEDLSDFAKTIIENTIKADNFMLSIYLLEPLCELLELYWFEDKFVDYSKIPVFCREEKKGLIKSYNLSHNAESYEHSSNESLYNNNFFNNMFNFNFIKGLNWTIEIVNKIVSRYSDLENPLLEYEVVFVDSDKTKTYWGLPEMWMATSQTYNNPMLVGDLLYILKDYCIDQIKNINIDINKRRNFANFIKNTIYEKTNNIFLLSIIEEIGLSCSKELPGYALDLVTNIDFVLLDYTRYSLVAKNPTKEILIKQMCLKIGLPYIKDRYEHKNTSLLVDYMANCQLLSDDSIVKKCYKIIDYLYKKNQNGDPNNLLQIQKMDVRTYKKRNFAPGIEVLEANITGEAKEIQNHSKKINKYDVLINKEISACLMKIKEQTFDFDKDLKLINNILRNSNKCIVRQFDDAIIVVLGSILTNKELDSYHREKYCNYLLSGFEGFLNNKGFIINDLHPIIILFSQVNENISAKMKKRIKLLMLNIIIFDGQDGTISQFKRILNLYLGKNLTLSKALYNTIIKLSENEMNHQYYNLKYYQDTQNEFIDFVPNETPHLSRVDYIIEKNGANKFESKEDEIITKYLIKEEALVLNDFNINNYDISLLLSIVHCNISLLNNEQGEIVNQCLNCLFNNMLKSNHGWLDVVSYYNVCDLKDFLKTQIIDAKAHSFVIDMLFNNLNNVNFDHEAVDFCNEIFSQLSLNYFDSYNNQTERKLYQNIILKIEDYILGNNNTPQSMYKSLIFGMPKWLSSFEKCKTEFTEENIDFINNQFIKFGEFCFKDVLITIKQFKIDKLVPNILISLSVIIESLFNKNAVLLKQLVFEFRFIVVEIITTAYLKTNRLIKKNQKLIDSYKKMLEILINLRIPEAAVLLDEFNLH